MAQFRAAGSGKMFPLMISNTTEFTVPVEARVNVSVMNLVPPLPPACVVQGPGVS
jgi:hypothetical protein